MPSADFLLLGPAWTAALAFLVFMVGACAGSFINCLAWRLMNGESVLKGRSHCVSCNHELGVFDLVPVFSWLFLRGKCRHCGHKVAIRYMAAELICGLYFLSIAWFYGLSVHCLLLWVFGCVLLGLSLCDIESFIIPNGFIIAGIALWIIDSVAAAGFPWEDAALDTFPVLLGSLITPDWIAFAAEGLFAAIFITLFMLLMTELVSKRKGVDSMGGGDLKLFFVVSLYLGFCGAFFNIVVCCVAGLVLGMLFKALKRKDEENVLENEAQALHASSVREFEMSLNSGRVQTNDSALKEENAQADLKPPKGAFPFGPAIALGTWISLLVGPAAVNAYLGLIFF